MVVDITAGSKVIGETDFTSGPSTLHPKAIYLVEGRLFQVESLDFEGRKAYVRAGRLRLLHHGDLLLEGHGARRRRRRDGARGRRTATCTCRRGSSGFKKIKFYTNENVGSGELDLPEHQMHTTAYWLSVPRAGDAGAAVVEGRQARRRRRAWASR